MSGVKGAFQRLGEAAGAAVLRELSERVESVEVAMRESGPLDAALERQLDVLERALVPVLEGSAAAREAGDSWPVRISSL